MYVDPNKKQTVRIRDSCCSCRHCRCRFLSDLISLTFSNNNSFIYSFFLDQAAIDLDQAEMEKHVAVGDFAAAQRVYVQGAHSQSIAKLHLHQNNSSNTKTITTIVHTKGTTAVVTTFDDQASPIHGRLYQDASLDTGIIHVQYDTTNSSSSSSSCQVGGSARPVTDGCKYP